jgi:glycosyltransferase involved in cell wall biosynthesis
MKEARLPERPLRVAMLLTELGPGGAERVVLELSKELKARGHSPLVVSLTPPPSNRSVPDALAGAGIETRYASLSKRAPWNLLRLAGILREAKPDLLHSHLMHPNIAARLLKPFFGCPLLNTVHIADRRAGMRPWFLMDRLTFPLCDACAAVSKAAASFHEAALGLAPGSLEVVYNGLDPVDAAPPETLAALKA